MEEQRFHVVNTQAANMMRNKMMNLQWFARWISSILHSIQLARFNFLSICYDVFFLGATNATALRVCLGWGIYACNIIASSS